MTPGRNDPCPCGSGKKYKKCCAEHDAAASPLLRVVGKGTRTEMETIAADAISASVAWEADVTPMPEATDDHSGRRAAVILAANGVILHLELETHPPSDAIGVAQTLAKAIDTVLARGGANPSQVIVRHRAVAVELGKLLGALTSVSDAPKLPQLDDVAATFRKHVSGLPLAAISQPTRWAAWQLPDEVRDRIISSSAEFYLAAPWQDFGDDTVTELAMPNGSIWNAVVLGSAGQEFGLVLYEKLDDYLALFDALSPEAAFNAAEGVVISLSFDARADLPKPMRREFVEGDWMVAGPSGYPSVWTLNTIGGGFSVEQADDLTMALDVLGRIQRLASDENDDVFETLANGSWADEVSGTIVRFAGDVEDHLWDLPDVLSTSLAEGKRADPHARLGLVDDDDAEDSEIVARFAATHPRDESDVGFFVQLMHGEQGVRLPAVTELDLRTFLYDLLPRKTMTKKTHGNAIRASLARFFDHLAANENLSYPWAAAILADERSFEERWDSFPAGRQQSDAVGEWMADLFQDLDARVMLPSNELAGLGTWGETQGIAEASLYSLLQREWLIWRDAEIALGHDTPKELWDRLVVRQAEWETAPLALIGGRSPSEEIAAERNTRKRAKPRPNRRR